MVSVGWPGQRPFLRDDARLVEGAIALEMRPLAAHERRHRFRPRQREVSRQPPEGPPSPRADPGLARREPIEHQTTPLGVVELEDALDGTLRDDGVSVDEAEHSSGAGGGAGVAGCRAGPATACN